MGAINKEFLIPYFTIFYFNVFQSYNVGVTPHISNYKIPYEAGLPAKVSYGPNFYANSKDL